MVKIRGKMHSISNVFLTKHEVSTQFRVLSLPMSHSKVDVLYVPIGLKMNRTKIQKSQSILKNIHPDDTNVSAYPILLTNIKIDQTIYINCT